METQDTEPDAVEADEYLEELPGKVVESIRHELSKNEAWLKVAEYLEVKGRKVISDECRMKICSSPERELLNNLMSKCFMKVEVLQKILKHCQLYDVLRIINTNDPAKIGYPLEDLTSIVPLGASVSLRVEVYGSPFPHIQWYFNGSPMVGETSPVLLVGKFSARDAGEYSCKIEQQRNGVLSQLTSSKYILNARETAPKISVDLKDVEIKAHENLILSFEVVGYPEPKCFKWFKNRNNMPISETQLPQLIIQGADVHNSGEYYCRASNTAGCCITRSAVVKVEAPMICPEKPEIIKQPKAHHIYFAGDWMYLTCEVLCSEKVKFKCFLNKEELIGSSNVDLKAQSLGNRHCCELKYCLTKEQMDKENLRRLHFQFSVESTSSHILSDDVRVEVRTREVKKALTARNKWALVIGNSHYQEMDELPGSRKDIHIMKKNLIELGFRVLLLNDLRRTAIQNGVKLFSAFMQKGDYVSFFYAGHGIHNDGKDYIIPVDATLNYGTRMQNVHLVESDISIDECISYVWITNVLQEHEPALIFSIYDTCRVMKPKFEGYQSPSSQHAYQTASKNSFSIFATSENYEAYETEDKDTSLLVDTLQTLMTYKISVQELSIKVLEKFDFPGEWEQRQVPKICGDLALPLSLADPSHPKAIDESESGVLKKWERLASGRGRMQTFIPVPDAEVEVTLYWDIEPQKDGVMWVISNSLPLIVSLSQDVTSGVQEMDVKIKLWTGKQESRKLRDRLTVVFQVPHLQDLGNCVLVELFLMCRGQVYKKEMHLESPAISQLFFKGNYID